MKKMKVAVFGCKKTTAYLIEELSDFLEISILITIPKNVSQQTDIADYFDLTDIAKSKNITCYHAETYSLNTEIDRNEISKLKLDIGFVIGWQRLIPKAILDTFSIGIFGMHGSSENLPKGRGRSPMNWALIERRKTFHTNLFRYDSGIDSGDILDSMAFSIQDEDTAETMHYKNSMAMVEIIKRNIELITTNKFKLFPQKTITPTYYPKRTPDDSIIDWDENIFNIHAKIRATTKPFNGAFSFINNEKIIIYRAAIFEINTAEANNINIITTFPSGKFILSCNGGTLIVHDYTYKHAIKKGMIIESQASMIKKFKKNSSGYYDLTVEEGK